MSEPCLVYGHHAYRAEKCAECRAEWLETGVWPSGSQHAKATHTPAAPDARERAAGRERDEEQS